MRGVLKSLLTFLMVAAFGAATTGTAGALPWTLHQPQALHRPYPAVSLFQAAAPLRVNSRFILRLNMGLSRQMRPSVLRLDVARDPGRRGAALLRCVGSGTRFRFRTAKF